MRAAKRAARSELSVSKGDWQRNGYARSDLLSTAGVVDQVERVHCSVWRPRRQRDFYAAEPCACVEEHKNGFFACPRYVCL